jgi:hypothetical protein
MKLFSIEHISRIWYNELLSLPQTEWDPKRKDSGSASVS